MYNNKNEKFFFLYFEGFHSNLRKKEPQLLCICVQKCLNNKLGVKTIFGNIVWHSLNIYMI